MAQPLVLKYEDREIPFHLSKVDRTKLYGKVELETLDEQGRPCRLVTLASDGRTMIGSGGVAMACFTPDGEWRDKSALTPVNLEGEEVQPVGSSFKTVTPLTTKGTIEDYLSHTIRSVYEMECEDDMDDLRQELIQGEIFSFPFSYRGSLETDTAFLLANSNGDVFMAVGKKADIQFFGFEQVATAEEEDATGEAEDEDMDFSMM